MSMTTDETLDKGIADDIGAAIDETIATCGDTVKKSFTARVRDVAATMVAGVYNLFNTPTFLQFREIGKEVAIQEAEMGVAKLLRELVWKLYDKYTPTKEDSYFYKLRNDSSMQWRMARTALLIAIFGSLAALMFRQAVLEEEKGNSGRANKINFVARACIKAIMVETGHAIDIDKIIGGLADTLLGYLPDVQKDVEEGARLVNEQVSKATNTPTTGVKPMPDRGKGR